MVNSGEVNGVPLHASKYLLTDVLRGEMGFEGMIVSDWEDIKKMHERHKVAATHKDAVFLAIEAGIDMVIVPMDFAFTEDLIALVKEGRILERRIDESVARILTLKKQVGLFESPHVEEDLKHYFGKPEYQDVALQAARESLVLLKNKDGILPLAEETRVLLTGPGAPHASSLHGAWSYSWQGDKEDLYPASIKSVKDVFTEASYVRSVEFNSDDSDFGAVIRAAKDHDVIVVALGEEAYAETPGNIQDLALPEDQVELVQQLSITGKPIVVVLLEARPRIINEIEPLIDGLVLGLWPGSRGADAIRDVIYGDYNPSGKLPITYPRYSGDLLTYDHKFLDEAVEVADPYDYKQVFDPQYEFGFGLSYTTFEYSDLEVVADGDNVVVSVTVTNSGDVGGQEVVELYTRDWYASITPYVKRLRRFEKILLKPGESSVVQFVLTKKDVSFVTARFETVFEAGGFDFIVGTERAEFDWQ
jgi:beta-glucosidase